MGDKNTGDLTMKKLTHNKAYAKGREAADMRDLNTMLALTESEVHFPADTIDPASALAPRSTNNKVSAYWFIMRELKKGRTSDYIVEECKELYGLTKENAIDYIHACRKKLDSQYLEYSKDIAKRNIECLQQIMDEALEKGQYRVALTAIDQLNRIGGLYSDAKMVIQSNEPINITFTQQ